MASENSPSHKTAPLGEYHRALLQLDHFLYGVVGDVTLNPGEVDQLKTLIRDPDSAIGKRARLYHEELAKVLDGHLLVKSAESPSSPNVA